ncbi:NTP transferase domain-containing protein [Acetohalobium arabaticum]|uniref:MobA-like NTP transferase domain-containing protein n=1 Tax=Acetohalobium arabaticum (strain ATCC 49924 / DSM 5501 / Z-7288) TaxID=574087 RepID=D9QSU5_ACEAZ|nr:NTP transferase domain-containing protein [Acetohalobium arabaticum]ADL11633.1 conserved hypothetical protein [Acetohalobium arabaticum DSM 5501]
MEYNAVLLAGAESGDLMPEKSRIDYEAFIEINGKAMISYVLEALNNAEKVNQIIVVGPKSKEEFLTVKGADLIVDAKDSIVENIRLGLQILNKEFNSSQLVLLTTSDIPLVTSEAIDSFITDCEQEGEYSGYYPVIPEEVKQTAYPVAESTSVSLQNDIYTGGNLALVRPKLIISSIPLLKRIIDYRKNPLKMSWILGLKFASKLLFGRLSLGEIEAKVSELAGASCSAVVTDYPELGLDVDNSQDLKLIRDLISKE